MRIATWNVNSLKARLEKVQWWIERAAPDVLMLQETKLGDAEAPVEVFRRAGYELAHHGQGQWNGVAIASRVGLEAVVTNFGDPPRRDRSAEAGDDRPLDEARDEVSKASEGSKGRMIAATCGGVRVVCVYAPNGRSVASSFYAAKLAWFERLARWLAERESPEGALVLGGDLNVAPTDADVWDPAAFHGATHVSPAEREAVAVLGRWGLVDVYRRHHPEARRFTWWDYRAGAFPNDAGMRIDHLLVTKGVAERSVWAEIDREARKGKPLPSDHTALVVDLDRRGKPFDAGWEGAEARRAARTRKKAT